MTVKKLTEGIKLDVYGKATGSLQIESLQIDVEILDARYVWDRIDYKVRPIQGTGEQWVNSKRVKQ